METIYTAGGYEIRVDTVAGKATIGKGGRSADVRLAPLNEELPRFIEDSLRKQGGNPRDFRHVNLSNQILRVAAAEAWNKALAEYRKNRQAQKDAEAAALEADVPGISALRECAEETRRYEAAIARMRDDEFTVRYPDPPKNDFGELCKKHPIAHTYLAADDWAHTAENPHKMSAGEHAVQLIRQGKLKEAEDRMNNWVPPSAVWD